GLFFSSVQMVAELDHDLIGRHVLDPVGSLGQSTIKLTVEVAPLVVGGVVLHPVPEEALGAVVCAAAQAAVTLHALALHELARSTSTAPPWRSVSIPAARWCLVMNPLA